jgi:anti-sigma factor RsiW
MMNHDKIREMLFDLYDRPLTERERQMVEGHLPDCPECRQSFEEWQKISRTLFALPAPSEAQEDLFVSKVMTRIAASQPAAIFSWNDALRWMVPLLGSSIAAVWFFMTALSGSGDLPSSSNVETAFSQDVPYSSSGNGIVLASYTSTDEIVP